MADPVAPAPPPPPTIHVNNHVSGTLPVAAANLGNEADALIISAGYQLHMPPRDVAVATNAGLAENQGTVSVTDTRGLLIEFPMVRGWMV